MNQIKGPAILLAQFVRKEKPFDSLRGLCSWAGGLGYRGVQIPAGETRLLDIRLAAESDGYCDEIRESCGGLAVTELAAHIFGQLVAVHPAYNDLFNVFCPGYLKGNPRGRAAWAGERMVDSLRASSRMGLSVLPSFSGALLWHLVYPWPQRPAGLVKEGFQELSRLWAPILAAADEYGVDIAYELHPGEDLHDGISFERFLEATGNHPRVKILYDPSHFLLQGLDYVEFIRIYGSYIRAFHVKDAEFRPSGRQGMYGGYSDWSGRAGRFRSLGDGQVDFRRVFTALTEAGFDSWAVLEWECAVKDAEQGAREGAPFILSQLISRSSSSFDDFAGEQADPDKNKRILGLEDLD